MQAFRKGLQTLATQGATTDRSPQSLPAPPPRRTACPLVQIRKGLGCEACACEACAGVSGDQTVASRQPSPRAPEAPMHAALGPGVPSPRHSASFPATTGAQTGLPFRTEATSGTPQHKKSLRIVFSDIRTP